MKIKEIIKKVQNNMPHGCLSVNVRCRGGFIALKLYPFNIFFIKLMIYTQYIIADMCYNLH